MRSTVFVGYPSPVLTAYGSLFGWLRVQNYEMGGSYIYINVLRKWYCMKLMVSPLNTKLYSLKVLFRLVPPSFTCISTSARS